MPEKNLIKFLPLPWPSLLYGNNNFWGELADTMLCWCDERAERRKKQPTAVSLHVQLCRACIRPPFCSVLKKFYIYNGMLINH